MAMANVKERPTLDPKLTIQSPTPLFRPKSDSKQITALPDTTNTNAKVFVPSIQTELKEESSQLLNQVQSGSGELLASSWQQVASLGGIVLGTATEQIKETASSSAQMVTNSLYQNTVGQVIIQLFNTLPKEAKKDVVEDICVETQECSIK
jgi:hypothetical protein